MSRFQHILAGTVLPDGEKTASFYTEGQDWQLYMTYSGGKAVYVTRELYEKWLLGGLMEDGYFMDFGEGYILTSPAGDMISSVEYGPYPGSSAEAEAFAQAYYSSGKRTERSLADGIYIARFRLVLPTYQDRTDRPKDLVLGKWLTKGMNVSIRDTVRIRKYADYLSENARKKILDLFALKEHDASDGDLDLSMPSYIDKTGLSDKKDTEESERKSGSGATAARRARKEGPFELPGREELERFFREDILDIIDREEEYKKFGVKFPGATIFYGPSGSGKTFAVDKFAEYLGWPVFRITSASVGSKYIHETSRLISAVFDEAIRNAPSIMIIDEMESFLSVRDTSFASGQLRIEEVDEFLRRIPEAAENHVLLFGMTNMMESIDEAVTRKGRFDHQIKVDMASEQEVLAVLEHSLADLPKSGNLHLQELAERLAGRPLSDVAYVVSEAGKLSVRNGKAGIDADALQEACSHIAPVKKKRKIGF